jgi:hypothetical protein
MSALACPVVDVFDPVRENCEELIRFVLAEAARQVSISDLERQLAERAPELLRKLVQGYLDLQRPAEAQGPVKDAKGTTLKPTQMHARNLESIFGTVEVNRKGYRNEDQSTASLHPLDGVLNLPKEKYSLEVRRSVAVEAAKGSFDEGIQTLANYTGAKVPKRQFEELVIRAAQDFDAFYEDRQKTAGANPEAGPILVLTVDGKGITMLQRDLRESTRKAAEEREDKFTARLGGGTQMNAKRMASVAAVYTVQPFVRTPEQILPAQKPEKPPERPRPENKRVWASLAHSPEEVIEEIFNEAAQRDPNLEKRWVALVDGNRTQIKLLEQLTEKREKPLFIFVDFIHVAQYVWGAAQALLPGDDLQQELWVRTHLLEILRGKASLVAGGMRRSATSRQMSASARKPVDKCAEYLLNNAPYLQYPIALAEGVPIATGVIEGACRHLVEDRMNLTGARWSLKGAEAVLNLRALRSSDDFTDYWKFHEKKEYERNHASRYADNQVPGIIPPPAFSSPEERRRNFKIINKKEPR